MAHETLKATIRQYIGPNGQNSITGQIMQDILIAMVDEYPNLSDYATQSWVTSQGYLIPGSRISLLGNDVGYLTSADLSGYATTSQLAGYLPLTGGTLTGDLNMAYSSKLNFGTAYIQQSTIPGPQGTNMGHILNFYGVDGYGYYNFDNAVNVSGDMTLSGKLTMTSAWLKIYGVNVGPNTVLEFTNSQDVNFNGGFEYIFDAQIEAPAFVNTSDVRKKTIIDDVLMDLDNVANAPLFKFTWKGQKNNSSQHIGTSAQYWQNILPELVSVGRDADMTLAIQYDVIALASAITVAKTVVDHEARIRQLEEKIK